MVETVTELFEYLNERGAYYGIPGTEIYDCIPDAARQNPKTAYDYMQLKDISHIEPLSKGGQPAGDNWILEDSSVNRARGAEEMTPEEQDIAEADGEFDAAKLRNAALIGGALTVGSAAAETALSVGAGVVGSAVEATFITTVVIPTVAVTVTVGGLGWVGWKLYKKLKR